MTRLYFVNTLNSVREEQMLTSSINILQGDQKVSVHLMITIQKVTSNVQSVPPPVYRHLLTRWTVFLKTVFSTAWSTFWMYSVMGHLQIINCVGIVRIHWVHCTETFWSPCILDWADQWSSTGVPWADAATFIQQDDYIKSYTQINIS